MTFPPPQLRPQQPPVWQQAIRIVMRWLISTLAIFVAVLIVPGIEFAGPGWQLGIVAAIFGLVNVLIRPLLALLTCPLILLTFGLFGLVINAGMLALTASIARDLDVVFLVNGFWPAVFGGLVISIMSTLLNMLSGDSPVVVLRREGGQQ